MPFGTIRKQHNDMRRMPDLPRRNLYVHGMHRVNEHRVPRMRHGYLQPDSRRRVLLCLPCHMPIWTDNRPGLHVHHECRMRRLPCRFLLHHWKHRRDTLPGGLLLPVGQHRAIHLSARLLLPRRRQRAADVRNRDLRRRLR